MHDNNFTFNNNNNWSRRGGALYHGMINGGHVIDTAYGQASVPLVRNETAKLTASDGAADDRFGWSVSISDGIVVIGAYWDDFRTGSAYVFEKNSTSGNWTQTAKLNAIDNALGDHFGRSVSVYNNTAVIGAYFDDDNGSNSGSAYVFEKNSTSGNWTQTETVKLTASDGAVDDYFGFSVSVYNNTAVIGTRFDDDNGPDSSSAYVFSVNTTSPTLQNATIDLLRNYQQNASFNQTDSSGHGITTKSSFHRILKLTRPHMMSLIQS